MAEPPCIAVEVAYASATEQLVLPLRVTPGTTAREAVQASGVLDRFPEIDPESCALGVFGERVAARHVLEAGDRVEIYRPLKADPKEVRRSLAAMGRTMGRRRDPQDPA